MEIFAELEKFYLPPDILPGHDITHIRRMVAMGPEISRILDFNLTEYDAACWLHNIDRCSELREQVERDGGQAHYCRFRCLVAGFSGKACDRIADAVVQHAKKDDEPGDSSLLTALRIADKLDRMCAFGIMASAAFLGAKLLPYDQSNPFGYESTAEKRTKTLYNNLFRVLEFYVMLPSDEARALVPKKKFKFFISYVRQLGEEIAEATGKPNEVEADIQKALGKYYERWK